MAIGSLAVRVSADTRNYNKNMRATRGPARDMRNRIDKVAKAAGAMSAALAATGGAITAHLVNKGMEAVTAQNRMARAMGATNKEIAALSVAFRNYGLQQDDISDALGTLTDRAEDAASGMKSMAEDFALVGLNVEDLRGKNPSELFNTFADAVANTEDPGKRTAAVVRTLGDDLGRRLMPMLMEGSGELERFAEQADRLGVSLSAVEAQQVEQASNAISSLGSVLEGIANQLALEFAPYIEAVADRVTETSGDMEGFTHHISAAVNMGILGFSKLADVMRGLHVVGKGIVLAFQGVGTAILSVTSTIQEGWERIMSKIAGGLAWLTRAANKLPGVDIPLTGLENFEQGLHDAADAQREARREMQESVAQTAEELHNLAMQPMPSHNIDKFLADVREKSRQAAEEVSASRERISGGGNGDGGGKGEGGDGEGDGGEADQTRQTMMKRLKYLTEGLATEREIKQQNFEKEMERMREQRNMLLMTEEDFRRRSRELEMNHWGKMAGLRESSMNSIADMTGSIMGKEAGMIAGAMQDMLTSTSKHSKKAFELQKGVATANAIIAGEEAATKAWDAGMSTGGPHAPAVAAAYMTASLAKTGAKIKSIQSQSFKGGSGGSTGSGGAGGVPTTGGGSVPGSGGGAEQGGGGSTVNPTFNIEGESISKRQFREMVEGLNETIDDGAQLGQVRVN